MNEEGLTDFVSCLITLDEAFDVLTRPGEVASENPADFIQAYVVIHHEMVHFWQVISTRFAYTYSCEYINLYIKLLRTFVRDKARPGDDRFLELREQFLELKRRLERSSPETSTPSAIDVIEGGAVLTSYRINSPRGTHKTFKAFCSNLPQKYTRAYKFAETRLDDLAFDLFAPACYLALQYRDPAQTLVALLNHASAGVKRISEEISRAFLIQFINEQPLSFLLAGSDMREDDCFPLKIRQGIPQGSASHPVLDPYIKTIATAKRELINDVFARPYIYFWKYYFDEQSKDEQTLELKKLVSSLLPPLFLEADTRRMRPMGQGQRLGSDYLASVVYVTSLAGMAERLFIGRDDPMICPHRECPVHKTRLCYKHYDFPAKDFRKCGFLSIFSELGLEWSKLGGIEPTAAGLSARS